MQTTTRRPWQFWATPGFALTVGIGYFAAAWSGGHLVMGAFMLGVMAAAAVASVLFARHSETLLGLMDHRDERITNIDLAATALSGTALIVTIVGAAVVDLGRGGDGMPYAWLGAVGGVSYIVAVVALRLRG
jgi:hypothetical protein